MGRNGLPRSHVQTVTRISRGTQIAAGVLPLFYNFKLFGKCPKIGQRVIIDISDFGNLWSGKRVEIRFSIIDAVTQVVIGCVI